MYAGGLLLLLGTPVALASYWGLLVFAAMTPFLIWRLFAEERFLAMHLNGYLDYGRAVPYRLVPYVW